MPMILYSKHFLYMYANHRCCCTQGQEKMSKSDPNSAIFMEDTEAEVKTKIKKAFCPPGVVEGNPCLAYIEHIVLPWLKTLEVARAEQNGGNK